MPKPANAKPFAERTWLQRRVPQCPMYGVPKKTDYAILGVAHKRIDPGIDPDAGMAGVMLI